MMLSYYPFKSKRPSATTAADVTGIDVFTAALKTFLRKQYLGHMSAFYPNQHVNARILLHKSKNVKLFRVSDENML